MVRFSPVPMMVSGSDRHSVSPSWSLNSIWPVSPGRILTEIKMFPCSSLTSVIMTGESSGLPVEPSGRELGRQLVCRLPTYHGWRQDIDA